MKLETALNNIEQLSPKTFNKEQKEVAKAILNNAKDEYEIEQFYKLIVQKVKLGFRFDESPIRPNGNISILKESRKIEGINLEQKNTKEHKLIIGENYDALKHLQITHKGKIDIIYIDPPYNTEAAKSEGNNHLTSIQEQQIKEKVASGKSSFIYRDKFSRTGWLNMMKERLELARELLSDQGVIFVSIDDNEQTYLKVLMDEIFGEENFICNFIWLKKNAQNDSKNIQSNHENVLFYSKTIKVNLNFVENINNNKGKGITLQTGGAGGTLKNRPNLGQTVYYKESNNSFIFRMDYDKDLIDLNDINAVYNDDKSLINDGYIPIRPSKKGYSLGCWTWSIEKMVNSQDELIVIKTKKGYKLEKKDNREYKKIPFNSFIDHISSSLGSKLINDVFTKKAFENTKPIQLIEHLLKISSNENSIILDFFAGSGTTGHAVMELNKEDGGNREFILVTNNESNIALDVTYERLHRIIKGQGTEGETDFKWIEKNKPYKDNSLRIFELFNKTIKLNTKIPSIKDDLIIEYQKLNPNLANDELNEDNLYNKLASLKQYEEVKDETD